MSPILNLTSPCTESIQEIIEDLDFVIDFFGYFILEFFLQAKFWPSSHFFDIFGHAQATTVLKMKIFFGKTVLTIINLDIL